MSRKRLFLFAAALTAWSFSAVFAASVSETFAGVSGDPMAGTSSLPGFTFVYDSTAPRSAISTASPFPGLADSNYLVVNGSVYDWLQFNGGTINAASGNLVQFALPLRVDSLAATAADTDVDILTLDQTSGSYSPYFNIRVSDGIFRTTNENGWPGSADPISSTAFDPASPSNWNDGRWHLLAFRVQFSTTAGAAGFKVYDINPADGTATLVKDYTGGTNTAAQATVNRFCAGLCVGSSPVGTAATQVSMDEITFWDDAFADDNAFLAAVKAKYGVASPTPVPTATPVPPATGTQIDACDSLTGWSTALPFSGAGESVQLTTDTQKQEGTASLKLTYTYTGNQWHEAQAIRDLTTPIDLSEALKFSFKLYGDAASDANLLWYIVFRTTTGRAFRYVNWGGIGGNEWQNIEIYLRDMEGNPWSTSTENPIASKVDRVSFIVQQKTGNTNSGTANVLIDDIQFFTEDATTQIDVVDNFDYASNAELQAAWTTAASGAGNAIAISSVAGLEGKAMQMDLTLALRWYTQWASHVFATPVDWSSYDFMRIVVKGQALASYPAGTAPTLMVYLEKPDATVQRMRAFFSQGAKEADWNTYILFFDKVDKVDPADLPTAPFTQDKWDGIGDGNDANFIDFSLFSKIHIAYVENALDTAYTTSLLIDKIEIGKEAPPPPPASAGSVWNLFE